MGENHVLISKGFRSMLTGFAPYIARELEAEYGPDWWGDAVLDRLYDDQRRGLPDTGDWGRLVDSLDIQRCLILFDIHWNQIFRKKLSVNHRAWAKELILVRNELAHIGGQDFSEADTWRALDTMARLCEQIDPEGAEEIRALMRDIRYGSPAVSTSAAGQKDAPEREGRSGVASVGSGLGLPSWREVMQPHPDVAEGRYKKAEFAADLAQVARGEGAVEYLDPVDFFARTYVTEGMKGLLVQALRRVMGRDGEPVIQLKTAFGGGKTHSMLALYHMLRGQLPIEKAPALQPVLEEAGMSSLPRVNVAVLVGTALDPSKARRPANFPGITIHTIWGEMAAQLAASAGKPELYDIVRESDKNGVSPGSTTFKELFDACGPCLILMDEMVAYARKIFGIHGLPAGSFGNFTTFIQEVTEGARASQNSMVVVSIPESDREIGDVSGQQAMEAIEKSTYQERIAAQKSLEAIEHTFGRMESIWKPVSASEGFEVVRRRLFLDCKDEAARDRVCAAFSQMYMDDPGDFPSEAHEVAYRRRMESCYPIHPELFDRLYEDWATLESFQRTRGVLRFMAAVIHELWVGKDESPMILPGSLCLNVSDVRNELTRYLDDGWNAVVDREVDGKKSIPYQKDHAIGRYGKVMAARRVSRTIMLGSAPSDRNHSIHGIESSHIRLGIVQPGENVADFNDALSTLKSSLTYLYADLSGNRYWYDTRPTLRKTVEDRMTQISPDAVDEEVKDRLKKSRKVPPFAGVHVCPVSSLDVPDEPTVRLVILNLHQGYKSSAPVEDDLACSAALDILNHRGTSQRTNKNMLIFLAPDQESHNALEQAVRRYLAWDSVLREREDLNLDAAQNKEAERSLEQSSKAVNVCLQETYCWVLSPRIDRTKDIRTIFWRTDSIHGGDEDIVAKTANNVLLNETVIRKWSPVTLLMGLEGILWKDDEDSIPIKQLWGYLCTYCYLPRLANFTVLEDAIRDGVRSDEYFALAAGKSGNRFLDLRFHEDVNIIAYSDLLVKIEAAWKQIAAEQSKLEQKLPVPAKPDQAGPGGPPYSPPSGSDEHVTDPPGHQGDPPHLPPSPPPLPQNTHFYLSTKLDNTRINRDVQTLVEEVVGHLTDLKEAKVTVRLEVSADAAAGVPQDIVRTVTENCQTLKVEDFGFDD